MLRRLLVPFLAAWAGLSLLCPIATAEPVFPPGLRIGLEPPGELRVSKHFSGFEDLDRKVAITILDLPARAYQDIERSVFGKDQQGLTIHKRESFPFESGIGILISGQAQENGVTVHKWFLLATAVGGNIRNLTTLVSVQVPETALTVYSAAIIRKALASITFRPMPIQEQLGLLPFKLSELAGFRIMQVLPTGGVILTNGQTDDISRQSYMIVSVGPGAPANPGDRDRFARDILATAPLRGLKIQVAEPMRISGSPGYEIRALATGPRGDAVTMVQWVRFAGSGYMRIIGVTRKQDWDTLFNRFRAVRDGIEFR
jgi:hypothetical protein